MFGILWGGTHRGYGKESFIRCVCDCRYIRFPLSLTVAVDIFDVNRQPLDKPEVLLQDHTS